MNSRAKDFPFYDGEPVALRAAQWGWLMLAVAAGFATLYLPLGKSELARFVPALLFPAIPLLALRVVVGPHGLTLFKRPRLKDIGFALGIALLNIVVTVIMGLLVSRLFGANANPVFGSLAQASIDDRFLFAVRTLPQLLGEELFTVLPFLALLAFFTGRAGLSRRRAVLLAWLVSALLFGLAHLPTYGWNWAQCVLIIGSARLVLSLAYLWTRNIVVSTLAHIVNDWTLFATSLLLATAAAAPS